MIKVGITGGIGTGKTLVCNVFKTLGIPVYNADIVAKTLVGSDPELKEKIIGLFGTASYTDSGQYNKSYISHRIFSDEKARLQLNNIIHPAVFKDSIAWFEKMKAKGYPYAIKEAAILFETGSNESVDKVIVVDAPVYLRLQRIIARDHLTPQEAWNRINNQMPQEEKVKRADYVIYNDGRHPVIPQIYKLHRAFINELM
jgi:dephospho-CoA kinase